MPCWSEQVLCVNHVGSRCYLCSLDSGSPFFSSFLLEKLLLNNSMKFLSVSRPGPTELMLGEYQPVHLCSEKGKVH